MMASRSRAVAPACTDRSHVAQRLAVQPGGAAGGPRLGQRNCPGDALELPTHAAEIDQAAQRQPRDGAAVRADRAAPPDQVGAVVVGRDGRDAELVGERQHGVLRRADERAAHVDRDAGDVAGVRASADPVAALEHQHVVAEPGQFAGGGEAGETGPHHDDVGGPSRVGHAPQSTPSPLRKCDVAPLKVFTALYGLTDAADRARELRDAGASGVATFEGAHDVFAPLTLAATVPGLDLMTNVAIAFPRNPIHLAHQANDHQLLSSGRFILGLGTQIRTQIEKRFGAAVRQAGGPDDRTDRGVAGDLRGMELRRAAWTFAATTTGTRLMTPTFNPGPNPYGPPPIYVGALGPRLTRAVAEHADGLLVMPFGSKRFLHEHTMPMVREGLRAAGRDTADFTVLPEIIVSAGETDAEREQADARTRALLAFYGSTPGVSAGAGRARLAGSAARTQHAVQAGPLGGDGRTHRRRDPAHHRRLRHPCRRRTAYPRPRRR